MSFVWPSALLLLVLVPALVAGYVVLLRRRTRRAAELAAKGFVASASAQRLKRLRHVPYAVFLLGLTLMIAGIARPQTKITVPRREGTVILAFDVSNSMRADDLKPTRMAAAKKAASAFVNKQPSSIKIGVVAFSDGSLVTQQPTSDRAAVLASIKRLNPQGGTSLGQGIYASLQAISGKSLNLNLPGLAGGAPGAAAPDTVVPDTTPATDPANPDAATGSGIDNVDIGYFGSAAIVLLSDGENTGELDPAALAKLSSTAGVKIYTVGIGSPNETVVKLDGFQFATQLNEPALRDIAKLTDGKYFKAGSAASLAKIYKSIDLQWKREPQFQEVTSLVAAAGAILLTIGAALSLLWIGRLV